MEHLEFLLKMSIVMDIIDEIILGGDFSQLESLERLASEINRIVELKRPLP
jgi:hypothetical protein